MYTKIIQKKIKFPRLEIITSCNFISLFKHHIIHITFAFLYPSTLRPKHADKNKTI